MKVHATDHGHDVRHLVAPAHSGRQAAHANKTHVASPAVPPTAEPPSDAVPQQVTQPRPDERDGQKVPGVVRLLEAGHFRGVADVRLRINFFDQLSTRATASAQPVIQDQSGELIETLSGELGQLLDGLAVDQSARQQIDELVGEFNASVQAAVKEFAGDGTINTEALAGAIQAAFNALVEQLHEGLTAPVPALEPQPNPDPTEVPADKGTARPLTDPGAEEVAATTDGASPALAAVLATDIAEPDASAEGSPVGLPTDPVGEPTETPTEKPADHPTEDPVDEPTLTLEEALATLRETFNEALSALLHSIQSAAQLPDPSPPNGNGVAYDKFLAIYNELRGLTTGDVDEVG